MPPVCPCPPGPRIWRRRTAAQPGLVSASLRPSSFRMSPALRLRDHQTSTPRTVSFCSVWKWRRSTAVLLKVCRKQGSHELADLFSKGPRRWAWRQGWGHRTCSSPGFLGRMSMKTPSPSPCPSPAPGQLQRPVFWDKCREGWPGSWGESQSAKRYETTACGWPSFPW